MLLQDTDKILPGVVNKTLVFPQFKCILKIIKLI